MNLAENAGLSSEVEMRIGLDVHKVQEIKGYHKFVQEANEKSLH